MLSAFGRAFKTPDLRRKLLFTLAMIVIYRVGTFIPAPGVSYGNVQQCLALGNASGGVYEDKGIPALQAWLAAAVKNPIDYETRLIPDDQAGISRTLVELVDEAVVAADDDGLVGRIGHCRYDLGSRGRQRRGSRHRIAPACRCGSRPRRRR